MTHSPSRTRLVAGVSVVLVVVLHLCPSQLYAQQYATDRGSFLIDGTTGWDQRTTTEDSGREVTSTSLELAPAVQFFVLPGLAVGGTLQYRSNSFDITEAGSPDFSGTSKLIAVGPTVSYYFGGTASRVHPFVTLTYLHTSLTLENTLGPDTEQTMSYLDAAVGAVVMLSDHVGLTGELYLRDGTIEEESGSTSRSVDDESFGLRAGVAAFVF